MARTNVTPASHWTETRLAQVLSPIQEFIRSETASGIVLIIVTVLALIIANSPLASLYDDLLHISISVSVGPFTLRETVLHWINDGLMAIFFFVVGLELKREALVGELADLRRAALPLVAAIGGAVVPAALYILVNRGAAGSVGWGVPMATDIAFALGVLALVGDRVPWTLKVFLTAVAVIDDLLAVLVIALFYTGGVNFAALGAGIGVLLLLGVLNLAGIRATLVYAALGIVVWVAFLQSGVHATIAGVLVALTVPARRRIDEAGFLNRVRALMAHFEGGGTGSTRMMTDEHQQSAVIELEEACEDVLAPLQKLEHQLHTWVAFAIVPIFALANAGVPLSLAGVSGSGLLVVTGVLLGLVVGKPLGLVGVTWVLVRMGVTPLPEGVRWAHVVGAGCLAGLGFTMSLFIATLGFGESPLLEAAKIGILGASLISGVLGYTLLRQIQ
jgi:Na+:H+ antiporter, NhaA family